MQKQIRIFSLLIVFSNLIACGDNSDIKKAVHSQLKDPESARFGEISTVKMQEKDIEGKNIEIACVTFNAKNSLGGYVGERQALVVKTIRGWEMDNEPSNVTHKDCVERLNSRAKKARGGLEPFVVALVDKGSERFVQLEIAVTLDDESERQLFNKLEPNIRNSIILYLSNQTVENLVLNDSKLRLSDEIRQEINQTLKLRTDFKVDKVIIKKLEIT